MVGQDKLSFLGYLFGFDKIIPGDKEIIESRMDSIIESVIIIYFDLTSLKLLRRKKLFINLWC